MLTTFLATLCIAGAGPCIVLDPGHPSENGVGSHGRKLTEVHAAWSVAMKLKPLLLADGYRVVLTKTKENQSVTNRRRAEIANGAHASLMLRLHCDAAEGTGIAVYYPARQGKVGRAVGPAKSVLDSSAALAKPFHKALVEALSGKLADRGLKTDQSTAIGGRQGALTGSIYAKVPVLLVEMCVLTNPKDEAFLSSEQGKLHVARALRAGVRAALPPPD